MAVRIILKMDDVASFDKVCIEEDLLMVYGKTDTRMVNIKMTNLKAFDNNGYALDSSTICVKSKKNRLVTAVMTMGNRLPVDAIVGAVIGLYRNNGRCNRQSLIATGNIVKFI
jgi:hypothetical protein